MIVMGLHVDRGAVSAGRIFAIDSCLSYRRPPVLFSKHFGLDKDNYFDFDPTSEAPKKTKYLMS